MVVRSMERGRRQIDMRSSANRHSQGHWRGVEEQQKGSELGTKNRSALYCHCNAVKGEPAGLLE